MFSLFEQSLFWLQVWFDTLTLLASRPYGAVNWNLQCHCPCCCLLDLALLDLHLASSRVLTMHIAHSIQSYLTMSCSLAFLGFLLFGNPNSYQDVMLLALKMKIMAYNLQENDYFFLHPGESNFRALTSQIVKE